MCVEIASGPLWMRFLAGVKSELPHYRAASQMKDGKPRRERLQRNSEMYYYYN